MTRKNKKKQGRNRKKEKEKIATQKEAQQQEATEKVVVENAVWLEHWNHNPNAVQQMQIELVEKKEFHLFFLRTYQVPCIETVRIFIGILF